MAEANGRAFQRALSVPPKNLEIAGKLLTLVLKKIEEKTGERKVSNSVKLPKKPLEKNRVGVR